MREVDAMAGSAWVSKVSATGQQTRGRAAGADCDPSSCLAEASARGWWRGAHGPRGEFRGVWPARRSLASPEPGQPRPRRGRRQGQGGRLCSGCPYQTPPGLEHRPRAEPRKVTEWPPRPGGPVTCRAQGSPAARPRSPLPGPSGFDPVGSERFSQVRESHGGPARQIFFFLPLGALPSLMPGAPAAISPSEDTGHHALWSYTLNTQRGRPRHRPSTSRGWEPCDLAL